MKTRFEEAVSSLRRYIFERGFIPDTIKACKLIFQATKIGTRDLYGHIQTLQGTQYPNPALPELRRIVSLGLEEFSNSGVEIQPYNTFTSNGLSVFMNNATLERAERKVHREDTVNLQFTSGMFSITP